MLSKTFKIFILIICFLSVFSLYLNLSLSFSNYTHNSKQNIQEEAMINELINYQGLTSNFNFGVWTLNKNGCGVIASYNILKILGIEENLSDIIKEYDLYGSNVFGLLGTNPLGIKRFFKRRNIKVDFHFKSNNFEKVAKSSKLSLLVYFSMEGGHYWLLDYDKDLDIFNAINPKKQDNFENIYSSIKKNNIIFLMSFDYTDIIL